MLGALSIICFNKSVVATPYFYHMLIWQKEETKVIKYIGKKIGCET